MIATADGHKFYVYLEGVRIPALSITMDIAPVVTSVNIAIFAHESAKDLKDGSTVAIFYTKAGLKQNRLLFFGFLNSRSYSKVNDVHQVTLSFVSRMAFLSRLHTAIYGKTSFTSAVTNNISTKNSEERAAITAQALGTGSTNVLLPTIKANDGTDVVNSNKDIKNSLSSTLTTSVKDFAVSGSSTGEVKTTDTKTQLHPFDSIPGDVSYTQPIKSLMDKVIKQTCETSGEFNKAAYSDRYKLENYISEMPGGWTSYFFGDDPGTNTAATAMATSFLKTLAGYLESLNSSSSVTDIYLLTMSLLMFEAWEIPGLLDGAQQLTPESIHSDIAMCNVIWPDMCTSVTYSEDSSQRVSRLVFQAGITHAGVPGSYSTTGNDATSSTSLGIYPAVDLLIASGDTAALKYYNVLYKSEVYNGTMTRVAKFPMSYMQTKDPTMLADVAEYSYVNASTAYSQCSVACHFYPELLPGLNAVVNDGMWKGVGKVVHIRHSIFPGREATTEASLSNYRKIEDYEYVVPRWYSDKYHPKNIDDLYYTNYGVNSIGGFLQNKGVKLETLVTKLNEMYESTSVKSHMAEKLGQREFMSQEEFFIKMGCTAGQTDDKGVVIYQGRPFQPADFQAYPNDAVAGKDAETVRVDRQQAVVDYLKKIYGRPAVKV